MQAMLRHSGADHAEGSRSRASARCSTTAVRHSPEASVAAYSLGDPATLARATRGDRGLARRHEPARRRWRRARYRLRDRPRRGGAGAAYARGPRDRRLARDDRRGAAPAWRRSQSALRRDGRDRARASAAAPVRARARGGQLPLSHAGRSRARRAPCARGARPARCRRRARHPQPVLFRGSRARRRMGGAATATICAATENTRSGSGTAPPSCSAGRQVDAPGSSRPRHRARSTLREAGAISMRRSRSSGVPRKCASTALIGSAWLTTAISRSRQAACSRSIASIMRACAAEHGLAAGNARGAAEAVEGAPGLARMQAAEIGAGPIAEIDFGEIGIGRDGKSVPRGDGGAGLLRAFERARDDGGEFRRRHAHRRGAPLPRGPARSANARASGRRACGRAARSSRGE